MHLGISKADFFPGLPSVLNCFVFSRAENIFVTDPSEMVRWIELHIQTEYVISGERIGVNIGNSILGNFGGYISVSDRFFATILNVDLKA